MTELSESEVVDAKLAWVPGNMDLVPPRPPVDHHKLLDAKAGIAELEEKFQQRHSAVAKRYGEGPNDERDVELARLKTERDETIDATRKGAQNSVLELLKGRLNPIWLLNRAVQTTQSKILDDMPVTEKHTDTWAWAVTVLQMHTGVLVQNHVQALELFGRYEEFVRVVVENGAFLWKGEQIVEHLSPVIDAHIETFVARGGADVAEGVASWEALKSHITKLSAISELRSQIGKRTTLKFLMATLVKGVTELDGKFKVSRFKSNVAPKTDDGKDYAKTSLDAVFDPLLTWCVTGYLSM